MNVWKEQKISTWETAGCAPLLPHPRSLCLNFFRSTLKNSSNSCRKFFYIPSWSPNPNSCYITDSCYTLLLPNECMQKAKDLYLRNCPTCPCSTTCAVCATAPVCQCHVRIWSDLPSRTPAIVSPYPIVIRCQSRRTLRRCLCGTWSDNWWAVQLVAPEYVVSDVLVSYVRDVLDYLYTLTLSDSLRRACKL